MDRAYSLITVKKVNAEQRVIEGIASTPTPDRQKDVVEPMGARFKLPMPLLWMHRHDQPVGEVEWAKPTKEGIPFRARIKTIGEPGILRDRLDEAWQSVKTGLVKAVSIGFAPVKWEPLPSGGLRFTEWSWMELSLVSIPANEDATIQNIKSVDESARSSWSKFVDQVMSKQDKYLAAALEFSKNIEKRKASWLDTCAVLDMELHAVFSMAKILEQRISDLEDVLTNPEARR